MWSPLTEETEEGGGGKSSLDPPSTLFFSPSPSPFPSPVNKPPTLMRHLSFTKRRRDTEHKGSSRTKENKTTSLQGKQRYGETQQAGRRDLPRVIARQGHLHQALGGGHKKSRSGGLGIKFNLSWTVELMGNFCVLSPRSSGQ